MWFIAETLFLFFLLYILKIPVNKKMLSQKLYKYFAIISKFSLLFGSSVLEYDKTLNLFRTSKDPKVYSKLNRNYWLILSWSLVAVYILVNYYTARSVTKLNISLLYWCGNVTLVYIYSIIKWFPIDFCRIINSLIVLLRYIHGKTC